jgi:tetratricopeptide (TPR) repeat protein
LIDSKRYTAREISEVAAAVATLEAESGSTKVARKLLERALQDPTENTIAQCSWLASQHRLGSFGVRPELLETPLSFEANALEMMAQGEYSKSVVSAMAWLQDEPFASRPAVHGSFLSSMVLGQYQEAFDFAEQGLVANPTDPYLLNNAAFALGSLDQLDEAQIQLKKLSSLNLDEEHQPMYLATSGFIAYRTGNRLLGLHLYTESVREAVGQGQFTSAVWALLLAAREEDRLEPGAGRLLREEALRFVDQLSHVDRAVADVLLRDAPQ